MEGPYAAEPPPSCDQDSSVMSYRSFNPDRHSVQGAAVGAGDDLGGGTLGILACPLSASPQARAA
jgi:hypothetical protein